MATANASATASPATHLNATLIFKAPSLYQLGSHFQLFQQSSPLNDTVGNRLRQEPVFMTGSHQGLIDSLSDGGLRPPGFIFSHAPVTRSPIISWTDNTEAKSTWITNTRNESAIQDLCLDAQQLSNMSIEIKATLRIAPNPDRVPAVTNANMLHER
ncbi:hypothetical protein AC578_7647 [Pseudocercospora eumusae]|uniref:Uncharacterized protein n=1 Tax=Pseudocercospora eumusae TaxID=321146 RepID=A0A139H5Y2_9PEZI|nr:hypothetical protein AC578_7647 [Pseudocercospora eumusae]